VPPPERVWQQAPRHRQLKPGGDGGESSLRTWPPMRNTCRGPPGGVGDAAATADPVASTCAGAAGSSSCSCRWGNEGWTWQQPACPYPRTSTPCRRGEGEGGQLHTRRRECTGRQSWRRGRAFVERQRKRGAQPQAYCQSWQVSCVSEEVAGLR